MRKEDLQLEKKERVDVGEFGVHGLSPHRRFRQAYSGGRGRTPVATRLCLKTTAGGRERMRRGR